MTKKPLKLSILWKVLSLPGRHTPCAFSAATDGDILVAAATIPAASRLLSASLKAS